MADSAGQEGPLTPGSARTAEETGTGLLANALESAEVSNRCSA